MYRDPSRSTLTKQKAAGWQEQSGVNVHGAQFGVIGDGHRKLGFVRIVLSLNEGDYSQKCKRLHHGTQMGDNESTLPYWAPPSNGGQ